MKHSLTIRQRSAARSKDYYIHYGARPKRVVGATFGDTDAQKAAGAMWFKEDGVDNDNQTVTQYGRGDAPVKLDDTCKIEDWGITLGQSALIKANNATIAIEVEVEGEGLPVDHRFLDLRTATLATGHAEWSDIGSAFDYTDPTDFAPDWARIEA